MNPSNKEIITHSFAMNIAFLYWVQKTDQELGRLYASLLKSIHSLRSLTCDHWNVLMVSSGVTCEVEDEHHQ